MIAAPPTMRILVLAPRLPWPPLDGGRVAMSRLIEALARAGAEVEVLSLNPRKHRGSAEAPLPLRAIDIDTSRRIAPLLRSLTTDAPYLVTRFFSRPFAEAISESLRRFAPDVVQIESPFLLPYLPVIRAASRARVVLRSLNVEFRIWERLAAIERNPLRRLALRYIASSLRRYEVRTLSQLDALVPISPDDAADYRTLGRTPPMHVIPCGVTLRDTHVDPEPNTVGFIGSLDFLPNQDAVRWILTELWPRVLAREPQARLAIAGSAPPPWLQQVPEVIGRVDDADAFVQSKSVFIAPLFAGGGMRIKVLEALALGKPVVATKLGAGGIDVADMLIAEDADSFAEAVVRLLREPELAARLGAAARAQVATRYDNDALARSLVRFYEAL